MTVSKKRDRVVVFRLTEQEYNCLKSDCAAAGSRSLSDYTRSELLSGSRMDISDSFVLRRFREMDKRITEVYRLTKEILDKMRAGESGQDC